MANTMRWKDYRFDYSAIRVLCVECCRCEYAIRTKTEAKQYKYNEIAPWSTFSAFTRNEKIKINEWWSKRLPHSIHTKTYEITVAPEKRLSLSADTIIPIFYVFAYTYRFGTQKHLDESLRYYFSRKPLFVYTTSRLAQRRSNRMIISLMWHTFGWRRCAIRHSQRVFILLFNSSFFLSLSLAILPILRYIDVASIANHPRFVYLFINLP